MIYVTYRNTKTIKPKGGYERDNYVNKLHADFLLSNL